MFPSPCPQLCHRLALPFIASPAAGRGTGPPGGGSGRSLLRGPPASGCAPSRGTRRCLWWSSCPTPARGAGRRLCCRGWPHLQGRGQGWGSAVTPPALLSRHGWLWLTAAGRAVGDPALSPARLQLRRGARGLSWRRQRRRRQVCGREGGEGSAPLSLLELPNFFPSHSPPICFSRW